jgi:hypothetical protein
MQRNYYLVFYYVLFEEYRLFLTENKGQQKQSFYLKNTGRFNHVHFI